MVFSHRISRFIQTRGRRMGDFRATTTIYTDNIISSLCKGESLPLASCRSSPTLRSRRKHMNSENPSNDVSGSNSRLTRKYWGGFSSKLARRSRIQDDQFGVSSGTLTLQIEARICAQVGRCVGSFEVAVGSTSL